MLGKPGPTKLRADLFQRLCLGLLLSIVDASIVATALVPIERYFDNFLTVGRL